MTSKESNGKNLGGHGITPFFRSSIHEFGHLQPEKAARLQINPRRALEWREHSILTLLLNLCKALIKYLFRHFKDMRMFNFYIPRSKLSKFRIMPYSQIHVRGQNL